MRRIAARWRLALASGAAVLLLGVGGIWFQLPALGAGGLLHPARRRVTVAAPAACREATFAGVDTTLRGWRCRPSVAEPLATVIYLHGIADNRASAVGVIDRYTRQGYEVVAYDSRGHGESDGGMCTYGYFEKEDLRAVIDTLSAARVVLIGTSLGAAVALQAAADDPRVSVVVAAETFADLRSIATDRAPAFFTAKIVARAFAIVEERGRFKIDDVSPLKAAARITVPVLVVHGEDDVETSPDHSRRVFAALRGPKRLALVPGAGHNQSLQPHVWDTIDEWLKARGFGSRQRPDVPSPVPSP